MKTNLLEEMTVDDLLARMLIETFHANECARMAQSLSENGLKIAARVMLKRQAHHSRKIERIGKVLHWELGERN